MTIRLYNTLSGETEDFQPLDPERVGIYCCGPTVYSNSHVGHMVGPVVFDTLKRFLRYNGYGVELVVNITDIDDKIINRAAEQGRDTTELAEAVTGNYLEILRRLDIDVDRFPKATEHVGDILALIGKLVEKGHAYPAAGDVYFDVTTKSDYGKLSNRRIEEQAAGSRKEVAEHKRNPGDFALWKAVKPGEPAWESPWGPGRPGWHIECSAMAMKYLGETFDIHGGGLDLCFPHHEDEIAQSEAATGKTYARYWLHNGLLRRSDEKGKLGGRPGGADAASQEAQKMSKSAGAVIVVSELFEQHPPELLRFLLLSTHYRSPIDFSEGRLEELRKGLGRLHQVAERIGRVRGEPFYDLAAPTTREEPFFDETGSVLLKGVVELRNRFLESLDDDFNTAGAIGVLFELAPELNRYIDQHRLESADAEEEPAEAFGHAAVVFRELTRLLGLLLREPATDDAGADELTAPLLDLLLEIRQDVRKAKKFELADRIRDRLGELGVTVEDGPEGSRWKR